VLVFRTFQFFSLVVPLLSAQSVVRKKFKKTVDTLLGTSAINVVAIGKDRNASLLIAQAPPAPRNQSRQTWFDEFYRELCATTTRLDSRRDGGGVARISSVRFRHGLQDPAPVRLGGAHLCVGVVLR